ncbi:hypothetical protein ILYODFUR_011548 [Ilyodon furcidens]|uniref:Uncharacterized protein n=1 Tax=Ilyodon furcidens TaxID=33524 RepID=A0ABV0UFD5_9TELE
MPLWGPAPQLAPYCPASAHSSLVPTEVRDPPEIPQDTTREPTQSSHHPPSGSSPEEPGLPSEASPPPEVQDPEIRQPRFL